MANTIDLHIHTTASDGSDSPRQLLEGLQNSGITTFSVTDHDTISGALSMEALVPAGMHYIRGIEFSCITEAGKCHILGYNYDPADPVFQAALAEGRELRMQNLVKRIAFVESTLDICLTEEEHARLTSLESPGKPHLAQILLDRGIAATIDQAIQEYINPCKISRERINAETAVKAILHAGGIPVWAHPLGGEGETRIPEAEFRRQLALLMGYGLQGLECFYSRYSQEEEDFLAGNAQAEGLFVSGGSDYHGFVKSDLPLGRLRDNDARIPSERLTILNQF
jgi:predicted metal-dependent phosphoesterase TrpH